MDEFVTAILVGIGAVVMLIGIFWLLVRAFRTSTLWGILCMVGLFLVFAIVHFRKAIAPLLVIVMGAAIGAFGPAYNGLFPAKPDISTFQDEQSNKQGEKESSETIGKKKDIERLKEDKGSDRLQLNALSFTVTSEDIKEIINGRNNLTYIDISNTEANDDTLELLVKMPNLTKLYASKSKMTAEGVKKFVFDNPECKLVEIDFRNLTPPVAGKDIREWKAKNKDRKSN